MKKTIIINGVKYDDLTSAARSIGCSFANISKYYNKIVKSNAREHTVEMAIKQKFTFEVPKEEKKKTNYNFAV